MDIAKFLEQIRSALNITAVAEALGESKAAELKTALTTIGTEHTSVVELLSNANSESKGRKLKLRETESKITDFEDEIERLKTANNTTELETEIKGLKEFKVGVIQQTRASMSQEFAKIVELPGFEKATPFLTLPAMSDDGKSFKKDEAGSFDFSGLSEDQIVSNQTELTKLHSLGVFEVQGDQNNNRTDGRQRQNIPPTDKIETIQKATTIPQLEAIAEANSRN